VVKVRPASNSVEARNGGVQAFAGRALPKRIYNHQLIRAVVFHEGPLSRLDLGQRTGLPLSVLTGLCADLIENGYLEEHSAAPGQRARRGRPRTFLRLAGGKLGAVCLRHGLEEIHAAVVDLDGALRWERRHACSPKLDARGRADLLVKAAREALRSSPLSRERLLGVGLADPGLVDRATGRVLRAANIPQWTNVALGDLLREATDLPVLLERGDSLQALGEAAFGAGRGVKSLLFISLIDHGVGGGIVAGGRLATGRFGGCGEIGHVNVVHRGEPCGCGLRGCLEACLMPERLLDGSSFRDFPSLLKAGQAGDRSARGILAGAAELTARALGNAVNLLNPERIVLGGYLAEAGDLFRAPLQEHLPRYTMREMLDGLDIRPAERDDLNAFLGVVCSFREALCAFPAVYAGKER